MTDTMERTGVHGTGHDGGHDGGTPAVAFASWDLPALAGRVARGLWYALRDGAVATRRSPGLAAATALTVALAATMAGAALVTRAGVDAAIGRWTGGVEFVVYLQPSATAADTDRVRAALGSDRRVKAVRHVTQDQARKEFARMYQGQGAVVDAVTADLLPSSFAVTPEAADERVVARIAAPLRDDPAVYQVVTADDTIREIRRLSAGASAVSQWLAVALAVVGVALCGAMIRTAVDQRRSEIEVMRLVGASRSYIAGPLVVETLLCAALGSVVAAVVLVAGSAKVAASDSPLMSSLVPPTGAGVASAVALVVVGTLVCCAATSAAVCTVVLRRVR